jgi:adenine/guanine phosphoribosyltransferase-like PRPP-binding protein
VSTDGDQSGGWLGSWVSSRFGLRVDDDPRREGAALSDVVGVALRRNPKRAHLLVSTVLGKHLPTDPRIVHEAGLALGRRAAERLGVLASPDVLVLGTAETATGLGHCVAEALGADCLHSTRRRVAGVAPAAGFEEPHSHATDHLLLPHDVTLLRRGAPVVVVDDELSTGRTALNTIRALNLLAPRALYVVATLADLRSDADQAAMDAVAAELGARIEVVALARGSVRWPPEFGRRAAEFAAAAEGKLGAPAEPGPLAPMARVTGGWPHRVRDGGRHGFSAADGRAARAAAAHVAAQVRPSLVGPRVLVLGFEELMYAPLLIALELAAVADVAYSTTTRTPVLPVDEVGYPIRTRLVFPAHDTAAEGHPTDEATDQAADQAADSPGWRYAYNVAPRPGDAGFDTIVFVVDDVGDTAALHAPQGLIEQLRAVCRQLCVVVVPSYRPAPRPLTGPRFGSYPADEVAWLLSDLSHVALEAPVEEREEAIQSGAAHYAESLPIEYQPSSEYQRLFAAALAQSADRVARAVGVVTELVLAERGRSTVLVSLARAGTPIGILMRRWAWFAHGVDLPHYTASIVRGRGFDPVAARYLAQQHDPAAITFVDGWTGKGAIARELAAAPELAALGLPADLAVLADTGSCVSTYGTREDFLIPSACLNSTVSGLVSRTVRNRAILAPGHYDGAKFYAELADSDVSIVFLDAVSSRFADVAAAVAAEWPRLRDSDRQPTWAGWAAVEAISAEYGISEVNLVKPGVGETTRVLLRRVPWRVLVRRGAEADLGHVLLLAEQRGTPVETVDELAYSCVGLIRPATATGTGAEPGRRRGSA